MKTILKRGAAIIVAVLGLMTMSFQYGNQALHFSLDLPDSWQVGQGLNPQMMVAMSPVEGPQDSFRENMNVIVNFLTETVSLQDVYEMNVKNARDQLPDFAVIDEQKMKIGGIDAIKLIYHFTHQGVMIKNIVYLLEADRVFYTMTFSTVETRFDEFRPTFETIADSFKPIKPAI